MYTCYLECDSENLQLLLLIQELSVISSSARHSGACLQATLRGKGRQISELKASLVYIPA